MVGGKRLQGSDKQLLELALQLPIVHESPLALNALYNRVLKFRYLAGKLVRKCEYYTAVPSLIGTMEVKGDGSRISRCHRGRDSRLPTAWHSAKPKDSLRMGWAVDPVVDAGKNLFPRSWGAPVIVC